VSPIEDISDQELTKALNSFDATGDPALLSKCQHIVISVPTPLTDYQPDLSYVESAAKSVGENLVSNQVIILESTTYPGTTLEVLVPNLEKYSNLEAGSDFFVGYSPERIDPGNKSGSSKILQKLLVELMRIHSKKLMHFIKKLLIKQ
jgi:UDP-N-acetyl-D-mannosaminuronate dehydrogenase